MVLVVLVRLEVGLVVELGFMLVCVERGPAAGVATRRWTRRWTCGEGGPSFSPIWDIRLPLIAVRCLLAFREAVALDELFQYSQFCIIRDLPVLTT